MSFSARERVHAFDHGAFGASVTNSRGPGPTSAAPIGIGSDRGSIRSSRSWDGAEE